MRRICCLVLFGVVATVLTGCGGGGSSTSGGSTTSPGATSAPAGGGRLTKADFIAQGDAICVANVAKEQALPRPSSSDLRSVASYLTPLIAIVADEDAKLRALKPPAADQVTINAALSELDTALADFRKAESAASAGNSAGFQSEFQTAKGPSDDATAKLHAYGFQHCPSPSGSAQGSPAPTQAPAP